MDLLAEVLNTFQLRSVILYRGCATAPWGLGFDPYPDDTDCQESGADATFHLITSGKCLLQLEGEKEIIPLSGGDFVVFPHGHTHSLRDAPGTRVYSREELEHLVRRDEGGCYYWGGGGEETNILCGKFFFENAVTNPLLRALPPALVVRGEAGQAVPWLEPTLQFIACETTSGRPGAQTVISRLADILFIQAVRVHVASLPEHERGFLRALLDPEIGPVLQAIHQKPQEPWTVAGLAALACMSRSGFAARFTGLVGESPLQYVTRWRVHVAATLLRRDPSVSLATVGERVGYESEAAFSKTFKRWTGVAPGAYRRKNAAS